MQLIYKKLTRFASNLKDIPLFIMRIVLAYGLYEPAKNKWSDIQAIGQWFESMNYPFPLLNAYLAATAEGLGVVFLALGLFTRAISIPLMVVMLVAIFTVHASNGFAAGDNGFEIPLYYLIMIFTLFVYGPGRISADRYVLKKEK